MLEYKSVNLGENMSKVDKAIKMALEYHGDQKYGSEAYIYHLAMVVNEVVDMGYCFENHLVCAYLHDSIEDTEREYEVIADSFGSVVADAVEALTKCKGQKYEDYIKKVCSNEIAWIVKVADTQCNLGESIKGMDKKRVVKYSKQLQYLFEGK